MWENLLDAMLRRMIVIGRLDVRLPGGRVRHYGKDDTPPITVEVHDPAILRRICLNPDMGVGEGYMNGDLTIDGDDLEGFIALAVKNSATTGPTWMQMPTVLGRKALRRFHQFNPAPRAQRNVAHHYDLSGELYSLFLDTDRQYSCAYFKTPEDSLEQAQAQKKAHIAGKLMLEPGMRVLDIGCGWGGMALTLARDFGAKVVGVTLSREQHGVATQRAKEAGLEGQVEFRLQDYRQVTETFDRIVSVGMFEHVGVPHYHEYFRHVRRLLTPEGVALIHTIGRTAPPSATSPWIDKYIFPGGYIPSMSEVLKVLEKEDLMPCDIEVWRLHYAETLKHWRNRFDANIDKVRALYDDRFCRMWRYYLIASEMTFRHDHQVVFQFQLARDQRSVPLTRDYLYSGKARGDQAA
ncbi:MAG: methyltransferase domain-containing protein [Limimaricola sp.]|uniref:SAM-dependent methyltransferase n=1 Tax=Limimaricola sp. TaxID=2211665 RepID=UPI001D278437|nr:cyclopropane-fatty-acyl-phospholipid synthase family protein [Limimaricola sp.]MBI1415837.1 methyltransferase domain-containing protein [Limimaricola sp.]